MDFEQVKKYWDLFLYGIETHGALVLGIGFIAFWFGFLRFSIFKALRLFRNRQRPIMIFKSKGEDMQVETKLLRDCKLFNIPEEPTDKLQDINRITNHCLVIIGYSTAMKDFNKIYEGVQRFGVPVIIYSKGNIPVNSMKTIKEYPWYSVCQVPLRLLNDVFTVLSTFPEKRQKE